MRDALRDIGPGLSHAAERGRLRVGQSLRRVAQGLVGGKPSDDVREPHVILADWREVEHDREVSTAPAVRDALSSALRAEYASALLARTGAAHELVSESFTSYVVAFHDPRAADLADELVSTLWRDAAARARIAFSDPGSAAAVEASAELEELRFHIAELEQALRERPWTEEY